MIDALYLIANSMTFFAACTYYNSEKNEGIIFSALASSVFGILYGMGVLKLFRWGIKLYDPKLLPIVLISLGLIMPWTIYRSIQV